MVLYECLAAVSDDGAWTPLAALASDCDQSPRSQPRPGVSDALVDLLLDRGHSASLIETRLDRYSGGDPWFDFIGPAFDKLEQLLQSLPATGSTEFTLGSGEDFIVGILADRDHDPFEVAAKINAYQGDLWFELIGPAFDKAERALFTEAECDDAYAGLNSLPPVAPRRAGRPSSLAG